MKKITAVLLALMLAAAFTGCGNKAEEIAAPESSSSASSVISSQPSSESSAESEESAESETSEESSETAESSETESEETSQPAEESSESAASSTPSSKPAESCSRPDPSPPPKESSAASSAPSSAVSSEPSSEPSSETPSEPAESTGVSASDIHAAINSAFESQYGHGPISNFPIEVDETTLTEQFHISADQVVSYSGTLAGMMTNCDILLVVQAKDGEIENVKAALQQTLSEQIEAFSWYGVMYNPERLDAAKVIVKGNYAALLIVGVSPEPGSEESVDFSDDVALAENAFYGAIG